MICRNIVYFSASEGREQTNDVVMEEFKEMTLPPMEMEVEEVEEKKLTLPASLLILGFLLLFLNLSQFCRNVALR